MTNHLSDRLAAELALCNKATLGPWEWGEEGDDWDNNGPDLETVERGPMYSDGSQGAKETIISAWGHDAWGINIEDADAEFIAHARTGYPLALRALQAVMEMHQPVGEGWIHGPVCKNCTGSHYGHHVWPCPTIQSIQEVYGDAGQV